MVNSTRLTRRSFWSSAAIAGLSLAPIAGLLFPRRAQGASRPVDTAVDAGQQPQSFATEVAGTALCTVQGNKEAKLTSYEPGSGPTKVWGRDADTAGSVSIYFNATGACWGQRLGRARIFYLQPGDHEHIMGAIDAGHAIEFWGVNSGGLRINNASKRQVG